MTFSLSETDGQTELTVMLDEFRDDTALFDGISESWPWILSSLNTPLGTGEALPPKAA